MKNFSILLPPQVFGQLNLEKKNLFSSKLWPLIFALFGPFTSWAFPELCGPWQNWPEATGGVFHEDPTELGLLSFWAQLEVAVVSLEAGERRRVGFSLGLSTSSLLYGPKKRVEWQDASLLQAKVGSFAALSCFVLHLDCNLSDGYPLNKAVSTPLNDYFCLANMLLLQTLHLTLFWISVWRIRR